MMKIKLSATTDKPPIRYRYNGGAWQDSPIFEVPLGAYPYTFEAIDADDCIEQLIVTENELFLRAIGGYFLNGQIHVTWATTVPATSQIDWGRDPELLDGQTTSETTTLRIYHDVLFPQVYLGASHYFRMRSTSALGQQKESVILGIICVPGELEIFTSNLSVVTISQLKPAPDTLLFVYENFMYTAYAIGGEFVTGTIEILQQPSVVYPPANIEVLTQTFNNFAEAFIGINDPI